MIFLDSCFDDELPATSKWDYVKSKLSKINNNLKIFESKKGVVFTQFRAYCPHCGSKNVVHDGYYDKKMILDYHGYVNCRMNSNTNSVSSTPNKTLTNTY